MLKLVGDQETGRIKGAVVSASANQGVSVTVDGKPARLAVVTRDGHVLDVADIATETFSVCVNAYRDFLRARGHLHTHTQPPLSVMPWPGRVSKRLAKRWGFDT